MLQWAKPVIYCLLGVPIVAGTLIAALPAFGYFPALGGDTLSLEVWRDLFAVPGLTHSIAVSLIAGLVTPAIALVLVFMFLASARGTALDRWMRRLISPLLAIPHAAAAFGLAFLITPAGLISRLISPQLSGWERPPDLLIVNDPWGLALVFGLVIKEIPFLLLMSLSALSQVQPVERVMVARSLGYSPGTGWLKTVAPSLYPLIRLPLFAVIAFASATVDVALILGPTLPPTLSVMILNWFNSPDLSQRFLAAAAALLQLGLTLTVILIWLAGERIIGYSWRLWASNGQRTPVDPLLRIVGRGGLGLGLFVMAGGLLTLAMNAFAGLWRFPQNLPDAWTLRHWARVLPDLATPLANTLIVSLLATAIAGVLVIAALEHEQRRGHRHSATTAQGLLYLPLLVPQVVFLFGMVVLSEFLRLQASLGLVVFAHLLFVLPYIHLSLAAVYRRLDPRWSQLAASLGASRNRSFWRVRAPLMLAPILTAMAIGVAISISLFLPTQLLGAGRITTVTTEALALSAGGNRNSIAVWAMLQASLPALGFLLALFLPRVLWRHRLGMRESE